MGYPILKHGVFYLMTRTFATYTDGGNFRYRTLVEYFKYKN